MTAHLAYLAQGKLHWHNGGSLQELESRFGRSLRDRAAQIHNRHAWKMQGTSAQFMRGMLWSGTERDPAAFRVALTSVTRGRAPGELLYSLETDEISGVFAVDASGAEQRLFHTADFRVRHLAMHPEGEVIAASICHSDLVANLALLNADGSDLREISEGDSMDIAPHWVPGPRRCLVFQSAGLGRDGAGRFSGTAPFAVQQLDLESGEISTLAEDPEADLLGPQKGADGVLYYIRRPRPARRAPLDPVGIVKDTVLFPFRLSFAVFQFFNFFSMRYTGRPLSTSRGAAQRVPDLRRMMVWGNLVDVDRASRENREGDPDAPSLVPSTWQLVRQSPEGKQVLAKGVLSFDVAPDGTVLYSNGSAVHRLRPDSGGPERIFVGSMIEQIAAL
ncbi:MAG TPA: hypothetical protein VKT49_22635 [Bryobacteraceae bacterium]|nr:hypothetical protein [Bryobacteraceae bacterium]